MKKVFVTGCLMLAALAAGTYFAKPIKNYSRIATAAITQQLTEAGILQLAEVSAAGSEDNTDAYKKNTITFDDQDNNPEMKSASIMTRTTKDIPHFGQEEVEREGLDLFEKMVSFAGKDYEALSRLFYPVDEESVLSCFEADWSGYIAKDQHYATYVCEANGVYVLNITAAIVAGQYPNYNTEYGNWIMNITHTIDGWKITTMKEGDENYNALNEAYRADFPEGMLQSFEDNRNVKEFDPYLEWWRKSTMAIRGDLAAKVKFLWQDESGAVYCAILIENGTSGNRAVYDIQLTITDDELGTIFDGKLEGTYLQASGTNSLHYFTISADQIRSGKKTWTNMHSNVHYSSR